MKFKVVNTALIGGMVGGLPNKGDQVYFSFFLVNTWQVTKNVILLDLCGTTSEMYGLQKYI